MSYEDRRINFDSYYDPPDEDDASYVTIFLEPGSVTDGAIAMYCAEFGCSAEDAVHKLISAGVSALLDSGVLIWTG